MPAIRTIILPILKGDKHVERPVGLARQRGQHDEREAHKLRRGVEVVLGDARGESVQGLLQREQREHERRDGPHQQVPRRVGHEPVHRRQRAEGVGDERGHLGGDADAAARGGLVVRDGDEGDHAEEEAPEQPQPRHGACEGPERAEQREEGEGADAAEVVAVLDAGVLLAFGAEEEARGHGDDERHEGLGEGHRSDGCTTRPRTRRLSRRQTPVAGHDSPRALHTQQTPWIQAFPLLARRLL
jgi:hypothetical protein